MEDNHKMAILESILFAMGESVKISKLADVIEETDSKTEKLLEALREKYETEDHGIELLRLEDSYQFATKPGMYDYLVKIAKTPRKVSLSEAVLETLSIIAYKQPVTKVEIEAIRGVACDYAVNKLIEFNLICELGRKDVPGRPLLFGTTEQFLRSFGVKSLKDLPELDTLQLEEFKAEAEQEIQLSLKV